MTAHALLAIGSSAPAPAPAPAPQPPGVGPNALLADGWPARILAVYWPIWEAFRLPITAIPTTFNVIHIFNGRFNTDGSVVLPLNPGDLTVGQLQTCVNRGQRIILTMGGAGLAFDFANRTQTTNFVNSVQTLINTTLGGLVTGLDWNNYEGETSINSTEMIWASQQLQIAYGPNFAIVSPPGATSTGGAPVNGIAMGAPVDLNALGAMKDAGVLTWAAPQFYDWSFYKQVATVKQVTDQWVTRLTETHTVIAFSANYNFTNALTLTECEREWDAAVAAHPNLRGMACWNAFTDTTVIVDAGENSMGAAAGNDQWGVAMRARLDGLYPPPPPPAPAVPLSFLQGVNLSSLEADLPGVKQSASTRVNVDFTVPRAKDLTFLASQGFGQHRFCMLWELVQPILTSSPANAAVLSAYGIASAGKLQPKVMGWILDVLDAAAAAGVKVVLDLHNGGRYKNFVYQVDGSITGFNAGDSITFPFTTTAGQTITSVMALAAGTATHPTITQADFNSFWSNFASYVEAGTGRHINGHAGLGGYGLMNAPNGLPTSGSNVDGSFPEDLTIWPAFAQGAVNTIRAIDATTPIFVSGNDFSAPWSANPGGSYLARNPGFPLTGANLVYESQFFLDANSLDNSFDWATEAAKTTSLGESSTSGITTTTGSTRAQYAVDFVTNTAKAMSVSELGMPIADTRWQTSMEGALSLLFSHGIGHYLWVGGNHWQNQGTSDSGIPNFKQGQTLLPLQYGPMHKAAGRTMFSIFADANTNWGPAGTVCTVTLYTRGYSPTAQVVTLTKASTGVVTTVTGTSGASTVTVGSVTGLAVGMSAAGTGIAAGAKINSIAGSVLTLSAANTAAVSGNGTFTGTLSASSATIPLGANQSVTFTYTTAGTEDATVTFGGVTVLPGVMHFYSMDPTTFAATDKTIAGRAALAKFGALEWLPANSFTDYLSGVAAVAGNGVRAIHNSGFGETFYSAHAMKNWINTAYGAAGPQSLPTYGTDTGGFKVLNFADSFGLWNRKTQVNPPGVSDPNPVSLMPYKANDSYFYIAGVSIASAGAGTVFMANNEQGTAKSELALAAGAPKLNIVNAVGTANSVTSASALILNAFHAVSVRSAPGAQVLRVDKTSVGTLALTPAPDSFTSMEIGFPFDDFFPGVGFTGNFYGAITGKGAPTDAEMGVMEDYLAIIGKGSAFGGGAADFPTTVAALTAWFDPSTLSTLTKSSVSGGAVTAAGDFVGTMNSRTPGTINLTTPDANRFVLRQSAGLTFLDTGNMWVANGGGGSTTGFFFIGAFKCTGGSGNEYLFIDYNADAGAPSNLKGYEIFYDFPDDLMVLRVGNGTTRTQLLSVGTAIGGGTGPAFVLMVWDDGTNLNMQINNGTVTSVARPVVVADTFNPILYAQDNPPFAIFTGQTFGIAWAKNSSLTSGNRAGMKTFMGSKAGLTL